MGSFENQGEPTQLKVGLTHFSLPKEAFLFSTRPELASVVAAKVEAIARAPQISSKGLLRVS